MSDLIIIAIVASIAPTITALAGIRIATKKANVIIGKADEIHELTNSNLTAVKKALAAAETKIEAMQKTLDKH